MNESIKWMIQWLTHKDSHFFIILEWISVFEQIICVNDSFSVDIILVPELIKKLINYSLIKTSTVTEKGSLTNTYNLKYTNKQNEETVKSIVNMNVAQIYIV